MVDVVICYSRENQATARQLAEGVSRLGYEVWRDEEAGSEAESTERVTDKIASAKAAIVIWSAASAASEWIKSEAILARGMKRLIQASADDRPPPIPFDASQVASISSWLGDDAHPGWSSIKASLESLAGPPAAGAAETVRAESPAAAFPPPAPSDATPAGGGDEEAKTVIGFAPLPPVPPAEPVPSPEPVAPPPPPEPVAAPPPPEPVAPPPTPEPAAPPVAADPLAATAVPGAAAAAAAAASAPPAAAAPSATPVNMAKPGAGPAPPKQGKGGLIIFLLLVLLAAAAGGGYYYYVNYWLPAHPPAGETPPPGPGAAPAPPEFPAGFTPPANGQATAPTPAAPPPEQFDREAVIAGTTPVVVHSAPTDLGIAVGRIAPGEVFSTFVQTGDFWRVRTANGTLGFISANVVRLRDASALPGTPVTTPGTTPGTATPGTSTRPTTRPNRPPSRPSRINRQNSAVMAAFCKNAGRGTPQCRSFQAEGGR